LVRGGRNRQFDDDLRAVAHGGGKPSLVWLAGGERREENEMDRVE
jgi:hypothetical protein